MKQICMLIFIGLVTIGKCQSILGLSGGYSSTQYRMGLRSENDGAATNCTSPIIGIFYKDRTEMRTNLSLSAFYLERSSEGYTVQPSHFPSSSQFDMKYKTLQFSIGPEFRIGKNHYFHFTTGIYLEYTAFSFTKGKTSFYTTDSLINFPYCIIDYYEGNDESKFISPLTFGIFIGSNFEYPLNKKLKALAELNYYRGYSAINGSVIYGPIKNSVLIGSIGIAYAIPSFNLSTQIKKFLSENKNLHETND